MAADTYKPPRMRTLPAALAELKRLDPETAVTMRALRRMVNTGEVKYVSVASKRLVNLDALLEYLANPPCYPPEEARNTGGIRRIDESGIAYV